MEQTMPTSEHENAVLIPPRTLEMFSTDCVQEPTVTLPELWGKTN